MHSAILCSVKNRSFYRWSLEAACTFILCMHTVSALDILVVAAMFVFWLKLLTFLNRKISQQIHLLGSVKQNFLNLF